MRRQYVRGCVFAFFIVSSLSAQTPLGTTFTYQGRLDDGGNPASGLHDLRFRLYDANVGGALIGSAICANDVSVTDGQFSVALDFGAQFNGQQRFLEIDVRANTGLNCGNSAGFVTLTPRQALTIAPHAGYALNADKLDGLDSTAFLQTISPPLTLNGTSPTHIIRGENSSATTNSMALLGTATANTGLTYGGWFHSGSTSGIGASGWTSAASGDTYGLFGRSDSTTGHGVRGWTTAATGRNYGVSGESASTTGYGIFGAATATTGDTRGVSGESGSTSGIGVIGTAYATTGTTSGVYGASWSSTGVGVQGFVNSVSGATYAGRFDNASTSGTGVFGYAYATTGATRAGSFLANSTTGIGVLGTTTAATGFNYGVWGESASTSGRGVYGKATATTGQTHGVSGESASTAGLGVYGNATAATGQTQGVWGQSASTTGTGVYGKTTATTGVNYGVWGDTNSQSGIGVYGVARGTGGLTTGVMGSAQVAGGTGVHGLGGNYGVTGQGLTYAIHANGDLGASGLKSFRIDHPDDPANKYLLHYAAESPEVINFYRGTVMLDSAGEALVELPHYFAKINKTPSYQLTAVGAPMPMLHVAAKINEADLRAGENAGPDEDAPACSFRIAGGAPGGEVSWRVEAQRNDRWVQTRGAPVEVEKPAFERGTYQHPDLYGAPPELGMHYDAGGQPPPKAPASPAAPVTPEQ